MTQNGGVDAFNLIPPHIIGIVLIVAGFGISLAAQYALATMIAAGWRKP